MLTEDLTGVATRLASRMCNAALKSVRWITLQNHSSWNLRRDFYRMSNKQSPHEHFFKTFKCASPFVPGLCGESCVSRVATRQRLSPASWMLESFAPTIRRCPTRIRRQSFPASATPDCVSVPIHKADTICNRCRTFLRLFPASSHAVRAVAAAGVGIGLRLICSPLTG